MSLCALRLSCLPLKSDTLLFWDGMPCDKGLWVTVPRQGHLDRKAPSIKSMKESLCDREVLGLLSAGGTVLFVIVLLIYIVTLKL